jgi:hypothetical protein
MDYKYKYIKYKEKYIRLKPKLSGGDVEITFSKELYNKLKILFENFEKYRNLFTNTDENKNILIDNIEEQKKKIEVDIKKEKRVLNESVTPYLLDYTKKQIIFFEGRITDLDTDKNKIYSPEYNSDTHNILIKKYMTKPGYYDFFKDLIDIIKFEESNSIKFINGSKKLSKNIIKIKINDNKNIIQIKDSSKEKYIHYNKLTIWF